MSKYLLFFILLNFAFQIEASSILDIADEIATDATQLKDELEQKADGTGGAAELIDAIKEAGTAIETAVNDELKDKLQDNSDAKAVTAALAKFKEKVKHAKKAISDAEKKSKADQAVKDEVKTLTESIDTFEKEAEQKLKDAHGGGTGAGNGNGADPNAEKVTTNDELNSLLARTESSLKKTQEGLKTLKQREDILKKFKAEIKKSGSRPQEEMVKFQREYREFIGRGEQQIDQIYKDAKAEINQQTGANDVDIKTAMDRLEQKKNHYQTLLTMEVKQLTTDMETAAGMQMPAENLNPSNTNPNNNNVNGRPNGEPNIPQNPQHPVHDDFGTADDQEVEENESPLARPRQMPNCYDAWNMDQCEGMMNLCKNKAYYRSMKRNCEKTCGHCISTTFECRDRFPPDCAMWGRTFCESKVYTKGMKLKQCARMCQLC